MTIEVEGLNALLRVLDPAKEHGEFIRKEAQTLVKKMFRSLEPDGLIAKRLRKEDFYPPEGFFVG